MSDGIILEPNNERKKVKYNKNQLNINVTNL